MKVLATTTFIFTLTGLCVSPSEARIGIPVGNIHRQQLEAEGATSLDWAQIGGNVQAGTNYWKESGFRVDISGDGSTLAIGSPLVNDTQGQVRVSRLNLTTDEWEPMGPDIAGDEEYSAAGVSVSLSQDGTILAVGFPAFNDLVYTGRCCGNSAARVYKWNQDIGDWEQLGSNIFDIKMFVVEFPEYFVSNQAGWAVSLSDDGMSVAVGAPNYFLNGTVGQVRVYHFDSEISNDWKQLGQSITGNRRYERVGFSVTLSGDGTTLALGDPHATSGVNATVNGRVQVFAIDETQRWEPIGNLISGEEERGQTGYSVSISKNGTNLAVGHPSHGMTIGYGSGLVRVYQINRITSNWDQVGPDIVPNTELEWEDGKGYGDGRSVSLSGDGQTVAVAAPSMIINDVILGLVRVFRFNAITANWDKIGRTIPGETDYESMHSRYDLVSLSSDGSRLVVGAPIHKICSEILDFSCFFSPQDFANWTGHVRVFDLTESSSAPSPVTSAPTMDAASTTIVPTSAPPTTPIPTLPPTTRTTSPTGALATLGPTDTAATIAPSEFPTIPVQSNPAPTSANSTPSSTTTPESAPTVHTTMPPTNPDSGGANVSPSRIMYLLLLSASLVMRQAF